MPEILERIVDQRQVTLWIPDGDTARRPVLLCHDGQNLFDGQHSGSGDSWNLAAALAQLENDGLTAPIVIGPWCAPGIGRGLEYAPEDILAGEERFFRGFMDWFKVVDVTPDALLGNAYSSWCAQRLLPSLRNEFNLSEDLHDIAVMGSSMGGLASLYAFSRFPEIYGTALAVSTHWTPGGPDFVRACINLLPPPGTHRLWFDHGDGGIDWEYGPLQAVADERMHALGWVIDQDFASRSYPGSGHEERSWGARVGEVLRFWLTSRP